MENSPKWHEKFSPIWAKKEGFHRLSGSMSENKQLYVILDSNLSCMKSVINNGVLVSTFKINVQHRLLLLSV